MNWHMPGAARSGGLQVRDAAQHGRLPVSHLKLNDPYTLREPRAVVCSLAYSLRSPTDRPHSARNLTAGACHVGKRRCEIRACRELLQFHRQFAPPIEIFLVGTGNVDRIRHPE